jgi:hypothetical protein
LLGTFVNRISGLFDRRFLIGSWFPSLSGGVLLANILIFARGWARVSRMWAGLGAGPQIWVSISAVAGVTMLAFVLYVAATLRLFEGYGLPAPVAAFGRRRQSARRAGLPENSSLRAYPRDRALIRPTRLGNVLTAAEEYSYLRYRMDAVIWWPRLAAVMPASFRDQLDETLLPLVTLTNLSLILMVDAAASGIWLAVDARWIAALLSFAALMVTAFLAYLASLSAAGSYAECVRTAFDLYRSDVLSAMRLPLPTDLIAERHLWEALTQWVYRGEPPQHAPVLGEGKVLGDDAFRYVHPQKDEIAEDPPRAQNAPGAP